MGIARVAITLAKQELEMKPIVVVKFKPEKSLRELRPYFVGKRREPFIRLVIFIVLIWALWVIAPIIHQAHGEKSHPHPSSPLQRVSRPYGLVLYGSGRPYKANNS